jgi:cell division protein ZipA
VNVRAVLGMMSELRWTLLILGAVFIAALAWWERRRPRQASGTVERSLPSSPTGQPPRALREPPLVLPEMRAREPLVPRALPVVEAPPEVADTGPLGAGTAEPRFADASGCDVSGREGGGRDEVEVNDIAADGGDFEAVGQAPAVEPTAPPTLATAEFAGVSQPAASIAREASPGAPALPRERLPELPAAGPPPLVQWPADGDRRVLALRLVAPQAERFAGRSLRQALSAEGFVLGPFAIFHKPDEERRAVLSAASLTRPGTFDMDTMDSQHYGGLSLFAVLPGPKPPPQAFEELVFAARNLNERLHGVLQDEQGSPLTPGRIALLREQLRGGATS